MVNVPVPSGSVVPVLTVPARSIGYVKRFRVESLGTVTATVLLLDTYTRFWTDPATKAGTSESTTGTVLSLLVGAGSVVDYKDMENVKVYGTVSVSSLGADVAVFLDYDLE